MIETKLYRKNQLGVGTWRIWFFESDPSKLYYAHAVVEGGSEVQHEDRIVQNQSGRSLMQQIELEFDSRVSRQLDKGYKRSYQEAVLGATNQLGLINPMLALPLNKVQVVSFDNCFVQPKFDGHRCLITRQHGDLFAYSRKGKIIHTVRHILSEFDWLPEGATVDGELYIHGQSLQSLASLIKREQDGSHSLGYHWYDFVHNMPFCDRLVHMREAYHKRNMRHVQLVDTVPVDGIDDVYRHFRNWREQGYEGAMLRLSDKGYQPAVRSNNLIKVKERHDCEVTVLGATPSKDGWAVLRVRTDWGVEFDTSAPGSVPEKIAVMQNIESYKGKRLTIEYAHLTTDQVPFHAVAIRWREDV